MNAAPYKDVQRLLRLYEIELGPRPEVENVRSRVIERMAVLAMTAVLVTAPAAAQHSHDRHHAHYRGWYNKIDTNCCNDQDCGELADADERIDGGVLAVRIEGMWCPVLAHHYLRRGNVPNASVSHVCVQKQVVPGAKSACERLLCYQPKPGT